MGGGWGAGRNFGLRDTPGPCVFLPCGALGINPGRPRGHRGALCVLGRGGGSSLLLSGLVVCKGVCTDVACEGKRGPTSDGDGSGFQMFPGARGREGGRVPGSNRVPAPPMLESLAWYLSPRSSVRAGPEQLQEGRAWRGLSPRISWVQMESSRSFSGLPASPAARPSGFWKDLGYCCLDRDPNTQVLGWWAVAWLSDISGIGI